MDDDKVIKALNGFDVMVKTDGKLPVTILTGFLGAGKTTLLNYILTAKHGKKYAIIENEVGQVGVDNQLLADTAFKQDVEESITILDNGCLCCTIRGDLVAAIQNIVQGAKAKSLENPEARPLDGILIETTGLADPGPICKTFYENASVARYCRIDGVVTVIDGKNFIEQLTRERSEGSVNESAQQVAFADKILLNKVDLCEAKLIQDTIHAIQDINHAVPIVKCSLRTKPDALPLETLLAIDAFDLGKMAEDMGVDLSICAEVSGEEAACGQECIDGHGSGHGDGHGHGDSDGHSSGHGAGYGHGDSHGHGSGHGDGHGHGHQPVFRHDTGVSSFVCEVAGTAVEMDLFQAWLQEILNSYATDLYRYKGILCMNDIDGKKIKVVVQGVHDCTNMDEAGEWPENVPIKSQLVFIGRNLKDEWKEGFKKCCEEN
eukprot:gnl/MRDRNA2_/MRDRNA2_107039_c0_seq1.p1 gnl/MRDRNA2_/MRDRNA2_107039_c0~~gnl/MRDRNA2_/MRDRNA2_107039_c0_seq1.p1  ORF type:complete len:491 (+),score=92.24 gnl/MRDRNA2_/MRDRNA2_107039_c0_seq1:176-1474(+)